MPIITSLPVGRRLAARFVVLIALVAALLPLSSPRSWAATTSPCSQTLLKSALQDQRGRQSWWDKQYGDAGIEFLELTKDGTAVLVSSTRASSAKSLAEQFARASKLSRAKAAKVLQGLVDAAEFATGSLMLITSATALHLVQDAVSSKVITSSEGGRALAALAVVTANNRRTIARDRTRLDASNAEVKRLQDCLSKKGDVITICADQASGLTVTVRGFASRARLAAAPCTKVPLTPPAASAPSTTAAPTSSTASPGASGLVGPGLPGGPPAISGPGGATFTAGLSFGVWAYSALPGRIGDPCAIQYVASTRPHPRYDNPANGYVLVRTAATQAGADQFIAQFSMFFLDQPDGVVKLVPCNATSATSTTAPSAATTSTLTATTVAPTVATTQAPTTTKAVAAYRLVEVRGSNKGIEYCCQVAASLSGATMESQWGTHVLTWNVPQTLTTTPQQANLSASTSVKPGVSSLALELDVHSGGVNISASSTDSSRLISQSAPSKPSSDATFKMAAATAPTPGAEITMTFSTFQGSVMFIYRA